MLIPYHLNPMHLLGKKIYPYLGYCLPLTVTKSTPFLAAFLGNLPETIAPKYPFSLDNWHTHAGPLYAFDWGGGGGGESGHGLRQDIIYCTFVPLMFSSMSAWEHNHLIRRHDELNLVFYWCLIETWWLGFRSDMLYAAVGPQLFHCNHQLKWKETPT